VPKLRGVAYSFSLSARFQEGIGQPPSAGVRVKANNHPPFFMSEHQRETAFLRRVLLYKDCDEHRKLDERILQVQHNESCVNRMALMMGILIILAIAGAAFGAILQANFPYDAPRLVIDVYCALVLAALFCLVGSAVLSTVHRRRLNGMREECRQLVTAFLESFVGKP
jgi:hypothetical protein